MGQKSNLLTIKKTKKVGSLASLNSQSFIKGHLFLDNFLKLLKGKNIYLAKKEFESGGDEWNKTYSKRDGSMIYPYHFAKKGDK